jgi:hydrogenase nickel incorporation protein HypA/HybF
VWVEIGRLSSVEPEALRFCFDAVSQDSIAQGCRLEVVEVAGAGWCMQCGDTVPMQALYDTCPRCGSCEVRVTGGMEMRVRELEVE